MISLLANIERELEETLNVTETILNNYNMKINMVKTNAIFRLKTAQKHKALYGCEA